MILASLLFAFLGARTAGNRGGVFAFALVMLKGKPGHCQRAEVVPVSKHDREHDVHRG